MTHDEQLIRTALEMAAKAAEDTKACEPCGACFVAADAVRAIDPADVLAKVPPALPVAYRVRVRSDDPEEWSYMSAARALDFLARNDSEAQPLYTSPTAGDPR